MLVDFHMHSTSSDGVMLPKDLRAANAAAGIKIMALTDHDTIDGSFDLIQDPISDIQVIRGCEFSSTYNNKDVHILSYDFDYANKEIKEYVDFFKESRESRIFRMIDRCKENGYDVSREELEDLFPHANSLGRPHLSQLLIKKGYVSTVSEAFNTILSRKSPCYVPKFKAEPEDVIDLIHRAGGVAVMAHPILLNSDEDVVDLLALPFDGIEVYHPLHSEEDSKRYRQIALDHNKLITGGSDYHGIPNKIPYNIGDYLIQSEDVAEFIKLVANV
ncbi:PHP domain-containing protein [uncultured Veillonella sp.]|uniref:PHP domain-containing protein n=1 Tax=uncultured Veillonella sp. TaxID=159268 RepID=UPI0025DA5525|nr:PHP domain-containing protein [uncultured Veillonella sp.]